MKIRILIFVISILTSVYTQAQKYIFKMYRFECAELFSLDIRKPQEFKVIDGITFFRVNEKSNTAWLYRMVLESKNKDCLILFPSFRTDREHDILTKNMVYAELKSALNLNPNDKKIELDSAKYIRIIPKDNNTENYFNADTVFIWKAPLSKWWSTYLPKSYNDSYNECVGIYVIKKGHPSALIKMLFTAEGKKKEEEYMQALLKCIHYSDITPPTLTSEKIEKTINKMKKKFIFNMKRYMYPGYVGYENRK